MGGVRCPGGRGNSSRSRVNKWLAKTPPLRTLTHLSQRHKNSNMSQAREAAARRWCVICLTTYSSSLNRLNLSIWTLAYGREKPESVRFPAPPHASSPRGQDFLLAVLAEAYRCLNSSQRPVYFFLA